MMVTLALLACMPMTAQAGPIILDISSTTTQQTIDTSSGQIGGQFIVANNQVQPTGTGVFNPFLTIQQTGQERGFNWGLGAPQTTAVLDEKAGGSGRTAPLLLSDLQTTTIGGVAYYQFKLDVNQVSNDPISLNQVQIFQSGSPIDANSSGAFSLLGADSSHSALISFQGATEVFRLNDQQNPSTGGGVSFDNNLEIWSPSNHGSGSGDMFLYVRASDFDPANGGYVTLFSQFGNPSGTYSSNDGFEEWGALQGPNTVNAVPAPPAIALVVAACPVLLAGRLLGRRKAAVA